MQWASLKTFRYGNYISLEGIWVDLLTGIWVRDLAALVHLGLN
jgi:hypothetical protein